jgi:capsular exopolysaccharide synthesis family protein
VHVNERMSLDLSGPLDLRTFLALAWRRRWLIAAVTALVLACALAWSFLRTPVYVSEVKVLIRPFTLSPSLDRGTPDDQLLSPDTHQELVRSTAVATRASRILLSREASRTLLERVSAKVVPDTSVLVITFSDHTAAEAQAGAAAFARAYLELRVEQAAKSLDDIRTSVALRLQQLRRELDQANSTLDNPAATPADRETAQALQQILLGEIRELSGQVSILSTVSVSPGQTIEAANRPSGPSSPKHAFDGLAGLAIGLALGVGVAVLRERTRERLIDRAELGRLLDRPVLAAVPTVRSWKRRDQAVLVVAQAPDSGAAEAFRALAMKLIVLGAKNDIRVLAITSASPGEGKTSTSANLALAMAAADRRVLLVSADLRRPRLHEFFDLDNKVGLSSLLEQKPSEPDDITEQGYLYMWSVTRNLHVLPSGPMVDDPMKALDSEPMRALLKVQRDHFDFILLDCPPIVAADSLALTSMADAVLFVADARQTNTAAVAAARDQLDQVGGTIVGAVLNRSEAKRPARTGTLAGAGSPARATSRSDAPGRDDDKGVRRAVQVPRDGVERAP